MQLVELCRLHVKAARFLLDITHPLFIMQHTSIRKGLIGVNE
jgi:hypothetical protein